MKGLALALFALGLASCGENQQLLEQDNQATVEYANSYSLALNESEMPDCDEDVEGQLVYVESSDLFKSCKKNKWRTLSIEGDQGEKGQKGEKGEKGEKGDTGAAGTQGEKGDAGIAGAQGEKGDTGDTGAQGIQGEKGDTAATAEWATGKKGTDIVSDTTSSITDDGDFFMVTDTVTIDEFESKAAGRRMLVKFDDVLTLTHGTNLKLKGKGNFKTTSGDLFEFISLGDGQWQEIRRVVANDSSLDSHMESSFTLASDAYTDVIFDTVGEDTQSEYDSSTGIFTAKQAGVYSVSANITLQNVSWDAGEKCSVAIYKNGINLVAHASVSQPTGTVNCAPSVSKIMRLSAGDTVKIRGWHNRGSDTGLNITAEGYNTLTINRL